MQPLLHMNMQETGRTSRLNLPRVVWMQVWTRAVFNNRTSFGKFNFQPPGIRAGRLVTPAPIN